MSFDRNDIRRAMDVYTRDNVYLGTVLSLTPGPVTVTAERVPLLDRQSSAVSGELLGPVPTQPLGNPGPQTQAASANYATDATVDQLLGKGTMRVGKWWGLVGRRTIPLDAVQTVSLERVVLRVNAAEL